MKVVDNCPSGALSYKKHQDSVLQNLSGADTIIKLQENGPLMVSGKIKIIDENDNETFKEGKFSLCRCGMSKKKPFCDASHLNSNFKS